MATSVRFASQHVRAGVAVRRVEVVADGHLVIDGQAYDATGLRPGESDVDVLEPVYQVVRTTRGDWRFDVAHKWAGNVQPATPANVYGIADFPTYPVWPDGEAQAPQDVIATETIAHIYTRVDKIATGWAVVHQSAQWKAWLWAFGRLAAERGGGYIDHALTAYVAIYSDDGTNYTLGEQVRIGRWFVGGAKDIANPFAFAAAVDQYPDSAAYQLWANRDGPLNLADAEVPDVAPAFDPANTQQLHDTSWVEDNA